MHCVLQKQVSMNVNMYVTFKLKLMKNKEVTKSTNVV